MDSQTHRLTLEIFCGKNVLFFVDTLHVQQLSNKMSMLLPLGTSCVGTNNTKLASHERHR